MNFLKNNWIYVIWFLFYFTLAWLILGCTKEGFLIVLIAYGVSISIALSPVGEWILRQIEGVREMATAEEIGYLQPIFEEVLENAKEKNPKLPEIKLYILDAMFVNAFALGRKTVTVTQGAIVTFTEEELKGILAHEIGHISHGHTKALLLSVVGNMFFTVFVLLFKLVLLVGELFTTAFAETKGGYIFSKLMLLGMHWSVDVSTMMFMYFGQIIMSVNSRKNEYQADFFAHEIGYGGQLISSLYILQKISGSQRMSLKEKMIASHPHIALRIKRLETEIASE